MTIKGKTIFVTGGAGFIGSHLVDSLAPENKIIVFDNLSSGREEFISSHYNSSNFIFIKGDLLDIEKLESALDGVDFVFHLAANPDIRYGISHTDVDLKQGTIATYNLLEAMRKKEIKSFAFSSTSAIYGEPTCTPTPENYGPLKPISLYGASKLACEGLATSFSHTFQMQVWMFRFANIIGARGTHGVIVDFIEKLKKNPKELEILGDGTQSKSYLLVEEVVDAIQYCVTHSNEDVNIYNLGCRDWINVGRIADILVEELGLKNVNFKYTGGIRGWAGDVPKIMLDSAKIEKIGWKAKNNSDDAVRMAIKSLISEIW